MTSPESKTFSIKTFGCKLNRYESERIAGELRRRGYEQKEFGETVDFSVINTCAVTDNSEKKCRSGIRAAALKSRRVVVAGCMAESSRADIEKISSSALILPNSEKKNFSSFCSRFTEISEPVETQNNPPLSSEEPQAGARSRAHLKIQDGCDGSCTYCIVPSVRGIPASRPAGEIIDEVEKLLGLGYFEIVLTGVTIGKYFSDGLNLSALLEKIISIKSEFRIRVTSIEPGHVDSRLAALFSSPKICRHIHLPLQSGSDAVLNAMRRPYSSAEFLSAVEKIRRVDGDIAVGSDVIAGFPSETALDFTQTLNVLKQAQISYIHRFRFSPRSGTPASLMKQLSRGSEISSRLEELKLLGDELSLNYRSRFINKILPCVIHSSGITAVSDNYIKIKLTGAANGSSPVNVRLLSAGEINTGRIV